MGRVPSRALKSVLGFACFVGFGPFNMVMDVIRILRRPSILSTRFNTYDLGHVDSL